jgi:hypothetical protein
MTTPSQTTSKVFGGGSRVADPLVPADYSAAPEGASLSASSRPRRTRTAAQKLERAEWRERLAAFFTLRAPRKTDRDVDLVLDHFEPPEGAGYEAMWREAVSRYGPEPPQEQLDAARRRVKWFAKLSSFYALVDSSKTHSDIVAILDAAVMSGRSYEEIWERAQTKYGVFVDRPHPDAAAAAQPERRRGTMAMDGPGMASPGQRSASPAHDFLPAERRGGGGSNAALPLREAHFVQRTLAVVLVSGVWMKLYRVAGPVQQQRFHHAVCGELADITNLPTDMTVVRVADHVDGVIVEVDVELPRGWTAHNVGAELVRKVTNGECTVAAIRQAYMDHLGGNPQRVFIADAAIMQYFTSPGLRYNVAVTGKPSAAAGAAIVDGGIVRDDFGRPESAAVRAGNDTVAAARDAAVYPRGDVNDSVGVRTPARRRHQPPGEGEGGLPSDRRTTQGYSALSIVEPAEASLGASPSPRREGHANADDANPLYGAGGRIPEWDVVPRPQYPRALEAGAAFTPGRGSRRDRWSSAVMGSVPDASVATRGLFDTSLPEGATAATPASFLQMSQMGSLGGGGGTGSSRAQEAHRQRGGLD